MRGNTDSLEARADAFPVVISLRVQGLLTSARDHSRREQIARLLDDLVDAGTALEHGSKTTGYRRTVGQFCFQWTSRPVSPTVELMPSAGEGHATIGGLGRSRGSQA
jgi:hypothetical protein